MSSDAQKQYLTCCRDANVSPSPPLLQYVQRLPGILSAVTCVDLSGVPPPSVGDNDILVFVRFLRAAGCGALADLCFSRHYLSAKTLVAVVDMALSLPTLRCLRLRGCGLDDHCLCVLEVLVDAHRGLCELDISENVSIDSEAARALQYRVHMRGLRRGRTDLAQAANGPGDDQCGGAGAVVELRAAIVQRCDESGEKFCDRDFPRGNHALWIDPNGSAPDDFPKYYTWVRAGERDAGATTDVSPPAARTRLGHVASAVYALCAKSSWLRDVFLCYDAPRGFAQVMLCPGDNSGWRAVTVDDYLPVDNLGGLCFSRPARPDDHSVLLPLVEKALAKLHRCYGVLLPEAAPSARCSWLDMTCDTLAVLTAGRPTVRPVTAYADPDDSGDRLWAELTAATSAAAANDRLAAGLLRGDSPGAGERAHRGILPDHLYGVARAVVSGGQRFVEVLNWSDGADSWWSGAWRVGGAGLPVRATPDDAQTQQDRLCMTLKEFSHVFTDVVLVQRTPFRSQAQSTTRPWDFGGDDGSVSASPEFRYEQFLLLVESAEAPAEVTVAVQQTDARLCIPREAGGAPSYPCGFGFLIVADNGERVTGEAGREVVLRVPPRRARENAQTLLVPPHTTARYVVVPYPDAPPASGRPLPFTVAAFSTDAVVRVSTVRDSAVARALGTWPAGAGGPPSLPSWRDNPQYLVYPSETGRVTLTLRALDAPCRAAGIGLTLHDAASPFSLLHFDRDRLVASTVPGSEAALAVELRGVPQRRGVPYIVVPFVAAVTPSVSSDGDACGATTTRSSNGAAIAGRFVLQVSSSSKVRLCETAPPLDWHRYVRDVDLSAAVGNTGGGPGFVSWRFSPQLLLSFPARREGRLFISAVVEGEYGADRGRAAPGLRLMRADDAGGEDSRLRRLAVRAEGEVLAEGGAVPMSAGSSCGYATELDTFVAVQPGEPLVLSVFTAAPLREGRVRVRLYSAAPLRVEPVREWAYAGLETGSWELGRSAGGSRDDSPNWINNPFFGLRLSAPQTRLVAVLVQFPRAAHERIPARNGTEIATRPPPTAPPAAPPAPAPICLRVAEYDGRLSEVLASATAAAREVVLEARLPGPRGSEAPPRTLLLVPHTEEAQHNGDFKILVFADQPFELFKVATDRLSYV